MVAPSGEQIELAAAGQRAVVVEVGAGLRSYESDGREILDGYTAEELCPSGRGQLLAPWPNRLEDGTYDFEGRTHRVALNEPERGNAIHGLVRWSPWEVAEREPHRVVLGHLLHPQPGYPFPLRLSIEYALAGDGLTVRTTATNLGSGPCPYGTGMHPYLRPGTPTVDDAMLRVPAATVLLSDERSLPAERKPVEGTEYDFRNGRPIGATVLDHAYTDLERDADGRARVTVGDLVLWVDEAYRWLMVFSGDGLPDVARRSLAVEPMTCPPNAFRSGEDLIRLEPGETATAAWGIEPPSSGADDDPAARGADD